MVLAAFWATFLQTHLITLIDMFSNSRLNPSANLSPQICDKNIPEKKKVIFSRFLVSACQ
jgi:hypothetical protein